MKSFLPRLSLLLLLLLAQHGAVVHELSHLASVGDAQAATAGMTDAACALCPAFAQAVASGFSHSFGFPILVRAARAASLQVLIAAIDTSVPQPRSRGPPQPA